MHQSPGRTRRILIFLGLATFIHIVLFLLWHKNSDPANRHFSSQQHQSQTEEHEQESDALGNVTAYSHIVKADVQRYILIPTLPLLR